MQNYLPHHLCALSYTSANETKVATKKKAEDNALGCKIHCVCPLADSGVSGAKNAPAQTKVHLAQEAVSVWGSCPGVYGVVPVNGDFNER